MSKLNLPDIGSLANSASARQAINDNFTSIEDAINNTISRDGTTPNSMEADLDLNSNKVINVADPEADLDAVNKRSVKTLVDLYAGQIAETVIAGTARVDRFVATSGQLNFTLTDAPANSKSTIVTDMGIMLIPDVDYTVNGTTLSFSTGRLVGSEIVVRYQQLAPSDGVLRADLASTTSTKGGALVKWAPTITGLIPRSVSDKLSDLIHVKDFGAKGDGTTDDTAAILAAVACAVSRGGGVVQFHKGVFPLNTTIVVSTPGVILRGEGCTGPLSGGGGGKQSLRDGAATRILWTGAAAGIMYRLTSNPNDDGTIAGLHGTAGCVNLCFDCAELASVGVHILSWSGMYFDNVSVIYAKAGGYGWLITTLNNGVSAGANDTQYGRFINCSYNEVNTAQTIKAGICIGKGASAQQGNVSLCSFYNLHSNVESAGHAMNLENVDNLHFYFYRGQNRTGAGGGGKTVLNGGDTGYLDQGPGWHDATRYCMFWGCSGTFLARQSTNAAYASSFGNQIFGLTRANNIPLPTIESRASLTYWETGGSGGAVPLGGSIYGRRSRGVLATLHATASIPNNVDTAVSGWDSTYATDGSTLSNAAGITVPNGVHSCSVEFQGSFAANTSGYRQVSLLVNGSVAVPNIFAKANASISGTSYVKGVVTDLQVSAGDVLTMSAMQTSGGALNLTTTDTWMRVRWM